MNCVLCGGEIPAGWPIVSLPAGLAHRFRTMCDELQPPEEEACQLLEACGQRLGFEFSFEQATALAGDLILRGSRAA